MPATNATFRRRGALQWSWPLRVTVPSGEFQLENDIRGFRFNSEFLQCTTLRPGRGISTDQQILLFPDGFSRIQEIGATRIGAEIVIIFETPGNLPKDFVQWDNLSGIARQFGAAGVFVLTLPRKFIPAWLDRVTQDLIGDRNFIETFAKYAPDGILLYDGGKNWDKPVSQALDHLQWRIARLAPGAIIPFKSSEQPAFAPGDLLAEVARQKYEIRDPRDLARLTMYLTTAVARVEYPRVQEQRSIRDQRGSEDSRSLEAAEMPSLPESPRFLQSKLSSEAAPDSPIKTHLVPHSRYKATVRIGSADPGYIAPPDAFPDSIVFEKSALTEEPVQLYFIADGEEGQTTTITLPRRGNSTLAEFDFHTGGPTDRFQCQIMAIHRNRVIQWVTLSTPVAEAPEGQAGIEMKTILCTRSALSNLANRSSFGATFIVEEADGEAGITALRMDGPVTLPSSQGARARMERIKFTIEAAAKNIEQYPEDLYHDKNVGLLRTLALLGESLYQHFTHGQEFIGPLQIVEHQSDFVPINFVYSFGPPAENAGLCEHAVTALKEGKCHDCFEKYENPASHICPFGFWGFSKVIEYCRAEPNGSGSDFILKSEPSSGRDVLSILNHTIHASAAKVEARKPGLRQTVSDTIAGFTNELFAAETWDEWADLTAEHTPDSIVLIVHTDKNDAQLNRVWIGEDPLTQNYLGKKHISGKQRPMAIVIGCEVSDIDDKGFDIGSEFLQKGASVVITNFTKIRGTQAARIVELLVKFLKEHSVAEARFGEVMLKLKQHLLAEGIIVSMSLVTYGDADWKFKS